MVSNSEKLLACLYTAPDDDVLAMAALDAVMEDWECGRHTAEVRVEVERELGRRTELLSYAANLMLDNTDSVVYIRSLIHQLIPRLAHNVFTLVIVEGGRPPHPPAYDGNPPRPGARFWDHMTITVGAEWVIQRWRDREAELLRRAYRTRPQHY